MRTNQRLKDYYNDVYEQGEANFFSKFEDGLNISENDEVVLRCLGDVSNKNVLDIGCGTGTLINKLALRGAVKAVGLDYSENSIGIAKERYSRENLEFVAGDFNSWDRSADIIISCGTIEHMDDPEHAILRMGQILNPRGVLILTCPHFYNIRGIIWITLQTLLNVPMSLTDVHSISPPDMWRWGQLSGLTLELVESFDDERANGLRVIKDMRKRLTNALSDANLPNDKVDNMLTWLNDFITYNTLHDKKIMMEGANCLYRFTKTKT